MVFGQMREQTYLPYFKREFAKKRGNSGVLAGSNAIACGYAVYISSFYNLTAVVFLYKQRKK